MKKAQNVISKISYVLFAVFSLFTLASYYGWFKADCTMIVERGNEYEVVHSFRALHESFYYPWNVIVFLCAVVSLIVAIRAFIKSDVKTMYAIPVFSLMFSLFHNFAFPSLLLDFFTIVRYALPFLDSVEKIEFMCRFIYVYLGIIIVLLGVSVIILHFISKKKVKENEISN